MRWLAAIGIFTLATACVAQEAPRLDDSSLDRWVTYLAPDDAESGWCSVPWRESFREGVRDSQIEGRPILLWAMNGHPMGCV